MEEELVEAGSALSRDDVRKAIDARVSEDLGELREAIKKCRRCTGGSRGIPGYGEPGSDLFMLAGLPGPGADEGNPWGEWRNLVLNKVLDEWGWDIKGIYLSTAIRCFLSKVTPAELRRCSSYLAEELFLVGPRLVVVSGKLAAVTLRAALGDEVPADPRAGDESRIFSSRFLFELDVARITTEKDTADTFWSILNGVSPPHST
jgi:uracil-DNA glycosylase